MKKQMVTIVLIYLFFQSEAIAERQHDWINGEHTRYSSTHQFYWTYNVRVATPQVFAVGLNLGAILYEKIPLTAQISPGVGGGKIGLGLGFGTSPEGPISKGIAPIGLGVKASAFQKWGHVSSEVKNTHSVYQGIEFSAAFGFAIDIGFYKEVGGTDRFTSIGIGYGF